MVRCVATGLLIFRDRWLFVAVPVSEAPAVVRRQADREGAVSFLWSGVGEDVGSDLAALLSGPRVGRVAGVAPAFAQCRAGFEE